MADARDPHANELKGGIDLKKLEKAVELSGYPLQTEVALVLDRAGVEVREEWSYRDRDTGKLRAIDLLGTKWLREEPTFGERLFPALALIIECKRSHWPYVFFRSAKSERPRDFPAVYGLKKKYIGIGSGKEGAQVTVADALRLGDLTFLNSGPPQATSFTRAERKGKNVKLSGADPFNRVMIPLVCAMDGASAYFQSLGGKGAATALTFAVCVVDAPMVLADATQPAHTLSMQSWVRIVRQEIVQERRSTALRFYTIDVVHVTYLSEYLKTVLEVAEEFAVRATDKSSILLGGYASVPDIARWGWQELGPPAPDPLFEVMKQHEEDED